MRRDELLGWWSRNPGDHRVFLRADGTAEFIHGITAARNVGIWVFIDERSFHTIEGVPPSGSQPRSDGFLDRMDWEIARESADEFVAFGRGGDDGTLEAVPSVWSRVKPE